MALQKAKLAPTYGEEEAGHCQVGHLLRAVVADADAGCTNKKGVFENPKMNSAGRLGTSRVRLLRTRMPAELSVHEGPLFGRLRRKVIHSI